jgi:hypothetical protein
MSGMKVKSDGARGERRGGVEGLGFPKHSKYLKEAQLTSSFLKDLNIRGPKRCWERPSQELRMIARWERENWGRRIRVRRVEDLTETTTRLIQRENRDRREGKKIQ